MKDEEVKARIRKKGLMVPIGKDYFGKCHWVKCRWINEGKGSEQFQVFVNGEWKDAESIDFEFNN